MNAEKKNNDKAESTEKAGEKPEAPAKETAAETHAAVNNQNNQVLQLNSHILRLSADFDNFRKRAEKEKTEKYYAGKESVLSKMIGLIDVFDQAIEMTRNANELKKTLDGLELLKKEFSCFVEKEGVKEMKSEGQKFDPFLHEAVGFELTDSPEEENRIVKEVTKGYMFNERVLRHPKVIILKKTEKAQEKKDEKQKEKEQ